MLTMSNILGDDILTHSNTLNNLVHGVSERVLYTDAKWTRPIQPDRSVFSTLLRYRSTIARSIGRQSPVARGEFPSFYSGPRKLVYERAVSELAVRGFRSQDATLKTFVKAEKINLRIKPNVVPRVIQPRNPKYNVEVGRYLKPIEHKIYKSIDKLFGSPTIMSEYNAFEQARVIHEKWTKFVRPVCVGLDASRFDQHVSYDALRFEHGLYNEIFKSKELRTLLRFQLNNNGVAIASDGLFRYKTRGGRASGDMNTSVGNKMLMCLMSLAYLESLKIKYEFCNNGDDCLIIIDHRHLNKLDNMCSFYRRYGFKIVTEAPVFEFEQIEFCQTKPVCSNGVWRMVRNLTTCCAKDVTNINCGHDQTEYRKWIRDVGNCGLAIASDVPVLGSFYRMLARLGVDGCYRTSTSDSYSWHKRLSKNTTANVRTVDDAGRYSYWLSTGVIPDVQVELESIFDSASWGDHEKINTNNNKINIFDLLQYGQEC